ncbi:MAG: hypothetical protein ABWX71_07150 [Aeromicrobium sp.]
MRCWRPRTPTRSAGPPRVDDELTWIRLATGRLPSDDPALPLP